MPDETPEGERGRYLSVQTGQQSLMIYRTIGLCEQCAACGCGEQQDPIDLSVGGIAKLLARGNITLPSPGDLMRMAKAGRNGR